MIAPPFIALPPAAYGGTELFLAHLAEGLHARGHAVTVYANGESRVSCTLKWRYPQSDWPVACEPAALLKNTDHTAWAVRDASDWADLIHMNDIVGLPFLHFVEIPAVHTLHHPADPVLSAQYDRYPQVHYVAISAAQARRERMPKLSVVHHGLNLADYIVGSRKGDYLAFLGRMAPCKGAHLAIEVARRAGLPLKLAGEIQPTFRDYWEREVSPRIDGDQIQYIGEADLLKKNELLAHARALLFPIQWDEPFGLVMIEAMACGTPVLAFPGGAVAEVVEDGVSGWICAGVDEMAERAAGVPIAADSCRAWVADRFSCDRMVEGYLEIYDRALSGMVPFGAAEAATG
ncbi:MAG TPA: glycosyltransferase family 4 protein [Vicinamibacterales bacterium]